jgi:Ca2+-binding RTX toxin-like protein
MATIRGTAGDDQLRALADGDRVLGLGGDDRLVSRFNATVLAGGDGRDVLRTLLDLESGSVTARQAGGTGRDSLTVRIDLDFLTATQAAATLDGGDGRDRLVAVVRAASGGTLEARNVVAGGDGGDAIRATAVLEGLTVRGVARNLVDGGEGNDRITARAVGNLDGVEPTAANEVAGGIGDDRIRAVADVGSNSGGAASNVIDGGEGDDVIATELVADLSGEARLASAVRGGAGNDEIDMRAGATTLGGTVVARHSGNGGDGDDAIESLINVAGNPAEVDTRTTVDGGAGDDDLTAIVFTEVAATMTCSNRVTGGFGNDRIGAGIIFDVDMMVAPVVVNLVNRVEGGAGNDEIVAAVSDFGRSVILGEGGRDTLQVFDGINNLLDGGAGADRLIGGDGDDNLNGGSGADGFVFIPTSDFGTDTVRDFDRAADRLVFFGLEDQGAPGLADDLVAPLVETVVDSGSGLDVTVTFDAGGVIVFEGAGTGAIDSIDDLVDDPLTQLVAEAFGPA